MDTLSMNTKAEQLIKTKSEEIRHLLKVQKQNLLLPECPLYQDVLDTQVYGLSCTIDFAVRLGLIEKDNGKSILIQLEENLLE